MTVTASLVDHAAMAEFWKCYRSARVSAYQNLQFVRAVKDLQSRRGREGSNWFHVSGEVKYVAARAWLVPGSCLACSWLVSPSSRLLSCELHSVVCIV